MFINQSLIRLNLLIVLGGLLMGWALTCSVINQEA